jgi:guanine deaminase
MGRLAAIDPDALMRIALDQARQGIALGQSPFGCAIALNGEILSAAHNSVLKDCDSTAHAEINALRGACRKTGRVHLNGAVVATTCEPCPMCMAALHWAQVDTVHYGAAIAHAALAGFNELKMPAEALLSLGGSEIQLVRSSFEKECSALFDLWLRTPGHQAY